MVDKGEVRKCHVCGRPLAKVQDGVVYVRKNSRGMPEDIAIEVTHAYGGTVAIHCPQCINTTPLYFVTLRHPTFIQEQGTK